MKRFMIATLMVCILTSIFCFAAAEETPLVPANVTVYYGNDKLDAPVYTDGTVVYVPLDSFIQMLGGSYQVNGDEITVSLGASSTNAAADGIIYEDDHISVKFSGFSYHGKMKNTGGVVTFPKIVVTNKTNEPIKLKLDWKKFYMNNCQIKISNTSEQEVPAKSKFSFVSGFYCVIDLSSFESYGETTIQHIEMDVDLIYGKSTQRVTWVIDCNIPVDSIQP
jgi:hypothetical protein